MKNFLSNLQSNTRFIVNVVLILIQFIIFGILIYIFRERAMTGYWIIEAVAVIVALHIIYRNISASYKISWIVFVLIFPIAGVLLYLLWGERRVSKKTHALMDAMHQNTFAELGQNLEVYDAIKDLGIKKEVDIVNRLADLPVWKNTKTAYLKLGEIMHQANLDAINEAEKFIFLEYFIVTPGKMYDELMNALYKKAEAGVDVRMMVDAGGSMTTMPKNFFKTCEEHQIRCVPFNPLSASLYRFISFRDHRKMTIVDGNVAIVGGINIGDEYIR